MKIKYLIFLILIVFSSGLQAQIDQKELLSVSENFISNISNQSKLTREIVPLSTENKIYAYVLPLTPLGFVVLTVDKDLVPILCYSTEHDFDFTPSKINVLLNLIEKDMENQFKILKNNKNIESDLYKNQKAWESLIKGNNTSRYDILVGPLLPSKLGEVNCVDENGSSILVSNYYTPNHYAPGCVATSISQIMHYYKWPYTGIGSHTDYDTQGSSQGVYSANYDTTHYQWGLMKDRYHHLPSDTLEQRAMGLLMYHTGIALNMEYEYNGSTSNVNRTPAAIDNHFRYCGHYQTKSWGPFWPRLRENLENGHPVQVAVGSVDPIGHAPVCDGYRQNAGEDRYYHLDMGWWGAYNAWYRIQGSFSAGGYTTIDGMVFDLLPDPEILPLDIQEDTIFTLEWRVAENFSWDAFQLQRYDEDSGWETLANDITNKFYTTSVPKCGNYQYRVRAKSDGSWYANSYSEPVDIFVNGDICSLLFDGDDSFFINEYNNKLDLDNTDWTIESWIKPQITPATSTFPVILSRKYSYEIYLRNSGGNTGVGMIAFDGGGTGFQISASLNSGVHTMSLDEWHHIAFTHQNNDTKLYIDGIEVASSTDPDFNLDASISALNIGARYENDSYSKYLQECKLDDIRISDVNRYAINFSNKRYNEYTNDDSTRVLLHLNEGYGKGIIDYANNFTDIQLRSGSHKPHWDCESEYKAYFVDATNGDDNNIGSFLFPWQTINKVNSTLFEPGDHIKFKRDKSWNETLNIQNQTGTQIAPIVFESYGTGLNPKINQVNQGVLINQSSFIIIKGFEITSDQGISIFDLSNANPSNHISIFLNEINDNNINGMSFSGIKITDGANHININENQISNHTKGLWIGKDNILDVGEKIVIQNNNIFQNQSHGIHIYFSNNIQGSNSIINMNDIHENGMDGIRLGGNNYHINHNFIWDNGQDILGGANGIHCYSRNMDEGLSMDQGGKNNLIERNMIYNTMDHTGLSTDGNGIKLNIWCDSNIIINNVIYNNDGSALLMNGANDNKIFNNTFHGNGNHLGNRLGQFDLAILAAQLSGINGSGIRNSSTNLITNNIGVSVGNEVKRVASIVDNLSITSSNIYNHNIWFNSNNKNFGTVDFSSSVITLKTLTEWNAFNWTIEEIVGDPIFVDENIFDFHLDHNSIAIDTGIDLNIDIVDQDFDLKPRGLLEKTDCGAYEHGIYWKGNYNYFWINGENWNHLQPIDSSHCVTIFPNKPYSPSINHNITIRKLYVKPNALLKINTFNEINIKN